MTCMVRRWGNGWSAKVCTVVNGVVSTGFVERIIFFFFGENNILNKALQEVREEPVGYSRKEGSR